MQCISVANQKGGVGKTTTAVNLAAAFAEKGEKVLVLDLDSQANATRWLGVETDRGILDVFSEDASLQDCVRDTSIPGVFCVPASPGLANIERTLAGEVGLDSILKNALSGLDENEWDAVFIDCPPALSLVTVNAFTASGKVLIPCETKALAIQGLAALMKTIGRVKSRLNDDLDILGIIPSRLVHTRLSREILEGLKKRFGPMVTKTIIRESTRLAEAPSFKMPITTYDPKGYGSEDFRSLATELKEKINGKQSN